MQESEFDKFAEEYDATLGASITASGEPPSFFYEYKVVTAAKIARERRVIVSRILDFGSGIGNSVPFFAQHFADSRLTCVDVSRRSLEVSASRFPTSAEHLQIQGAELPFVDKSFDLVFSACVFHHIAHSEHETWLSELRRVCRPGGIITVFEHNPWNPLTRKVVRDCPFDTNARLITAPKLRQSLAKSGWCQPRIRYTLFFPRWLAPLRPAEGLLRRVALGAQYAAVAYAP